MVEDEVNNGDNSTETLIGRTRFGKKHFVSFNVLINMRCI